MTGRWDEKENPYEKLLRELMPQRVDNKKEVKAMESRKQRFFSGLLLRN